VAWQSRVARVMRRDDEAANTADQARRLLSDATRTDDRLFVEAVGAESDRDVPRAQARYVELTERHRDDPSWFLELAAFQDRHAMNAAAIETYRQALARDARLPRPHLELCRMYNRSSEPAKAKEEGQLALTGYRNLGARGGEAQSFLCLTDTLRIGTEQDVRDARVSAGSALEIFRTLGSAYNLARAYHYVALTEEAQGNLARAAASWEESLDAARKVGNTALQSVVLMNLGVSYDALGNRERAVDYFRQGSTLHEALGNEQEAARSQANAGRILIEFGGNPEQGLRDVQNALGVFQKLGDKNFEVFAAQNTALYHRNRGQYADAERDLNRALSLARERDLDDEILSSTLGLALSRFDRNEYTAARGLIQSAVGERTDRDSVEARIYLGRIDTRLGNFDAAQATLVWAESQVNQRGDTGLLPLLHLATGELAYQTGRSADARQHFSQASSLWSDDLPDASSVEARSYLGLLDALQGQATQGREALRASLAQAQRMGRVALEARCRLHLAQIDVLTKQLDEAGSLLDQIPPDSPMRAIGPELQAQTHFWRSRVLAGRGDSQAAQREASMARSVIESLRASLAEPDRRGFASRVDIRLIGH
jgi:tetratricopeptide (TPR) repeat protein